MSIPADRMSPEERRAGASLAAIFALRMLGLFLILPVFSVYAKTLPGGDNLALVGFALGAYGLTQALFQIPYGIASDLFGRKRVIVIGLHSGAEIDWVMSHNPNVVFADFSPVGDEHDSVRSDLDLAMRKLLQALDDQGYRRMAFIGWDITSSRSTTSISDRRLPAYQDWMRAKGRYEPDLCRIGDNTEQSGYELTLNLLQSGARPDALITGNDNMAVGAYRAIHESGLKIPGDIAVASFNDIPVAQFLNPPLTTVRLPAEEIGQNAVDLLFEQLSGRSTPKCILLSSRVILRASTRGKGKSGVK